MIIYGFRTFQKIMGSTKEEVCNVCGQSRAFNLVRARTWFTLMFIPIFPVKSQFFSFCTHCRNGAKLDKSEFNKLLEESQI